MRWVPHRRRRALIATLTFDDGTSDHRRAAELLAAHGVRASFYVNSNRVGSAPDRLGWDDLSAIAELGHEIGGHGSDHLDLTKLSLEDADLQVREDRAVFLGRGLQVETFAYPYGAMTEAVGHLVERAGYTAARRAWGLADDASVRDRPDVESLPPADRFAIRTLPMVESHVTAATLAAAVERAASREGWLPLVFHRIDDSGDRFSFAPAQFELFVRWLADQSARVARVTLKEALAR